MERVVFLSLHMKTMTTYAHIQNNKLQDEEPVIDECGCTFKVSRQVALNYNFLNRKIMTHGEGARQVRREIRILRGGW